MTGALKVAVAGAGYFARLHHEAWGRVPGVVFDGICDISEAAARAAGEAAGVPHFSDVAAMLDTVQPDLLDIATPPQPHLPLIRLAMERGIAVICQKPFCASPEEARQAVELAQLAGKFICIHENFRFQPWYRKVKELLDGRALGQVYQVTFRFRPGDGQGPDAYLSRQPYFQSMERFLVHETGVHWIDTFRYLFGNPSAVFADLRRLNPVIAGEDAGLMIFDLPGGVRGVLDGNRLVDHAADNTRRTMGEMLVEGSAGCLRLDGFGRLFLRQHSARDETQIMFDFNDMVFGGDCVFNLCNHVARHVLDGSPLENEASDYLVVQTVEWAIYMSAQRRCWQGVDIQTGDNN